VPVSQWMKKERTRVAKGALAPEVTKMYASAMKLSPRFAKSFREFWSLKADFKFKDAQS
jgi:acetone carboxylase alpha subunit